MVVRSTAVFLFNHASCLKRKLNTAVPIILILEFEFCHHCLSSVSLQALNVLRQRVQKVQQLDHISVSSLVAMFRNLFLIVALCTMIAVSSFRPMPSAGRNLVRSYKSTTTVSMGFLDGTSPSECNFIVIQVLM